MISIYVGNLPYDTTEAQLVELFSPHGEVHRASLVMDRETGRPRGFGFVEMPDRAEAERAIEALAGTEFSGRPLTVNEARRNPGRNTANLSRSAQRGPGRDGGSSAASGPSEPERSSTGYAAKPAGPEQKPDDDADESHGSDAGTSDDADDDGAQADGEGTGHGGGYRNDRV